jgi:very-short-patch-repair endonuclease
MKDPITLPRNPSQETKRLNPKIYGTKKEIPTRVAMPRSFEALQGAEESPLERRFNELWDRLDALPELRPEREFIFAAPRKWRFDFAWVSRRVALELEGGLYSFGRHQRPAGFVADCDKYFEATLRGWTVIRLPSVRITDSVIRRIYDFVRTR